MWEAIHASINLDVDEAIGLHFHKFVLFDTWVIIWGIDDSGILMNSGCSIFFVVIVKDLNCVGDVYAALGGRRLARFSLFSGVVENHGFGFTRR